MISLSKIRGDLKIYIYSTLFMHILCYTERHFISLPAWYAHSSYFEVDVDAVDDGDSFNPPPPKQIEPFTISDSDEDTIIEMAIVEEPEPVCMPKPKKGKYQKTNLSIVMNK